MGPIIDFYHIKLVMGKRDWKEKRRMEGLAKSDSLVHCISLTFSLSLLSPFLRKLHTIIMLSLHDSIGSIKDLLHQFYQGLAPNKDRYTVP